MLLGVVFAQADLGCAMSAFSRSSRPRSVSSSARGCSKISFSMKCLYPAFSAMTGDQEIFLGRRLTGVPSSFESVKPSGLEHGDLAVFEEYHLVGVGKERWYVACAVRCALGHADHERG